MTRARVVLAALLVGAAALVAVELATGAAGYGRSVARDPCGTRQPFAGSGVGGEVQQIVLSGLDGAACELHTTREQLVLSLVPSQHRTAPWTRPRVERAVRAGLERSIADAQAQGKIGGTTAAVLRELVRRAPLDVLIEGAGLLPGIF